MDRATAGVTPPTPIPNLSTFGRIRDWWQGFAASQLRHLFEESRSQRGGEVSARARAEQIAAIYRGASLPQRAAILNLITHEFAPDRNELATAIAAMQAAGNEVELGS